MHLEYTKNKVFPKDLRFDTQIKALLKDYLVLKMIMICGDSFPVQSAFLSALFVSVLYLSCNILKLKSRPNDKACKLMEPELQL